jgi:hypothetical protein
MQRRNVMRLRRKWIVAVLVVTGLLLPGCTKASVEEPGGADPASVEPIEGSDVSRVILSSDAARRLDVQTAPVGQLRGRHGEKPRLVMPYGPKVGTEVVTVGASELLGVEYEVGEE